MVWKAHTIKGSNVLNKGIGVISLLMWWTRKNITQLIYRTLFQKESRFSVVWDSFRE